MPIIPEERRAAAFERFRNVATQGFITPDAVNSELDQRKLAAQRELEAGLEALRVSFLFDGDQDKLRQIYLNKEEGIFAVYNRTINDLDNSAGTERFLERSGLLQLREELKELANILNNPGTTPYERVDIGILKSGLEKAQTQYLRDNNHEHFVNSCKDSREAYFQTTHCSQEFFAEYQTVRDSLLRTPERAKELNIYKSDLDGARAHYFLNGGAIDKLAAKFTKIKELHNSGFNQQLVALDLKIRDLIERTHFKTAKDAKGVYGELVDVKNRYINGDIQNISEFEDAIDRVIERAENHTRLSAHRGFFGTIGHAMQSVYNFIKGAAPTPTDSMRIVREFKERLRSTSTGESEDLESHETHSSGPSSGH